MNNNFVLSKKKFISLFLGCFVLYVLRPGVFFMESDKILLAMSLAFIFTHYLHLFLDIRFKDGWKVE